MTIMIILSFLLTASFVVVAIWRAKSLPDSISALVYDLPKKKQWVWSAWLAMISALLFVPLTDACGGLGWLTEVCLMGAALTPLVNTDTKKWHNIFGITAGVLSQICVAIICPKYLLTWIIIVFIFAYIYIRPKGYIANIIKYKETFILEILSIINADICLLLNK